VVATLPDGSSGIVWEGTANTTNFTDPGGGWANGTDPTNSFPVNPNKSYMVVGYTQSVSGSGGSEYLGIDGASVCTLNTTAPDTNPYFIASVPKQNGVWHLCVGWVYPAATAGHAVGKAGVYSCSTGALVSAGTNFNWKADTQFASMRMFQFYQSAGAKQRFCWPAVYVCDGSEPSVDDLLSMATAATANAAWTNAIAAQNTANTAASNATTALARQADFDNDNVWTPGEKPGVIQDVNVIGAEQAGIDAQATNYAVTTEKAAYDAAVSALASYLGTLTSPYVWSSLSGNTNIVGATARTKFEDVYTTRQAVLDKVAANAKSRLGALALLNTVGTTQIDDHAVTATVTFLDAAGVSVCPAC
jgi:hypothetical protein